MGKTQSQYADSDTRKSDSSNVKYFCTGKAYILKNKQNFVNVNRTHDDFLAKRSDTVTISDESIALFDAIANKASEIDVREVDTNSHNSKASKVIVQEMLKSIIPLNGSEIQQSVEKDKYIPSCKVSGCIDNYSNSIKQRSVEDSIQCDDISVITPGAQFRLLLVCTFSSVNYLIKRSLERAGFVVDAVTDGDEAWKYLDKIKSNVSKHKLSIHKLLCGVVTDVTTQLLDVNTLYTFLDDVQDRSNILHIDSNSLAMMIKNDSILKTLSVVSISRCSEMSLHNKNKSKFVDIFINDYDYCKLSTKICKAIKHIKK